MQKKHYINARNIANNLQKETNGQNKIQQIIINPFTKSYVYSIDFIKHLP